MKTKLIIVAIYLLSTFLAPLVAKPGDDQEHSKLKRVVDLTSEKSIFAKVTVSNGMVYINKAEENAQLFAGEFLFANKPPLVAYEIIGDEGRLNVKLSDENNKKNKFSSNNGNTDIDIELDEVYDNECYLNFSNKVPLSFRMEFGVIKGDMNLGGLRIEDCEISTAVSQATIDFEEGNPIEMDHLDIENGVGKLKMFNLGKANFRQFSFEGGVGSYVLDFRGGIKQSADADVEIGMGKLKMLLPRSMPVRLEVDDSFLSSVDVDDVRKEDGIYYNDAWDDKDDDDPQLNLRVETGVASVTIKWVDDK